MRAERVQDCWREAFDTPQPHQPSDIDEIGKMVVDLTARLNAILGSGQSAIDRRYGPSPEAASGKSSAAPRDGTLGALRDAVDSLEAAVDRASYVVARLGDA